MMRIAQVNADGAVVNVILVDSTELENFRAVMEPDQLLECPDIVGPNWTYDGVDWKEAPVVDQP